eukprot:6022293-Pleurochrysis_carterae.AAC.8
MRCSKKACVDPAGQLEAAAGHSARLCEPHLRVALRHLLLDLLAHFSDQTHLMLLHLVACGNPCLRDCELLLVVRDSARGRHRLVLDRRRAPGTLLHARLEHLVPKLLLASLDLARHACFCLRRNIRREEPQGCRKISQKDDTIKGEQDQGLQSRNSFVSDQPSRIGEREER